MSRKRATERGKVLGQTIDREAMREIVEAVNTDEPEPPEKKQEKGKGRK